MGNRLSKIYTRTGDDGTTGLADGGRIAKDSPRVNAMGELDELNSVIGMVLAESLQDSIRSDLNEVQHKLFDLGSELCLPGYSAIDAADVSWLEQTLDRYNAELPPLKEFILPGGGRAAAACHLARAVCRRTERRLVTLAQSDPVAPAARAYVNRLSDLLFVLGRVLARNEGSGEVLWRHQREPRSDAT